MGLMKKDIKVTVVIAVYNSEKYLCHTLDSVCAQTLQEIEIICVDDGSSDASLSVLERYAKSDDRIVVLKQPEPSDGAAKARNLGIQYAHGNYLCILDSDDFFEPDMLERAYRKAVNTDSDIVIYDGYVFDEMIGTDKEVGFILYPEHLPKDADVFRPADYADRLFQMTIGAAWNCLVKRSFAENYALQFQSFHHADDLGFVYLAFACADKIAVLRERFVHYRMNNGNSQSANISKWPETAYQAFAHLQGELLSRGIYGKFKVSFVQAALSYIMFYLENMRNYRAFTRLYENVRNKYLNQLEILDIPDDKFMNPYLLNFRNALRDMTAAEYLYQKMYRLPPFQNRDAWKENIPEKSRMIIYGAGKLGAGIFSEIIREKRYKILAWVDRNFQEIGYPVMSPECIRTAEFDYILVALESESLYKTVYMYLIECGVPGSRILWIGEKKKTACHVKYLGTDI